MPQENPGLQEAGSSEEGGGETAKFWIEEEGLREVVGHVAGQRVRLDET